MQGHMYHWKHGWIPLDHYAALVKAKGSHKLAAKYLNGSNGHHGTESHKLRGATHGAEKRVHVEHSGDGTLLHIDRSDQEARDAAKAAGFKWSSNLGSWYLPRNWNESTRRNKVDALKARMGAEHVHVEDAGHGVSTTAAEREAATRARAADRAERMDARAQKATAESERRYQASHDATSGIPFGQPILMGHHSQRRHERAIEKSRSNMDKSVQADREAKDAQAAAERARQVAAGEDPLKRQRRIDKNEAEIRKIDRRLQEHDIATKAPAAAARVGIRPLSPDYHSQLTASRAELADQVAHDKAQIEASGHKALNAADVQPGDVVTYRGRPYVVKKVNKTTVSVPTGYSWDDKVPLNQVTSHKKLADLSETTLRAMVQSTQDAKIREQFMKELNRRGVHIGR